MPGAAILAAVECGARSVLSESVTLAQGMALPRGADPFVGAERPMALVSSHWTRVAGGGILLGGSPAAMTALFGLDAAAERMAADRSTRPEWEEELRVAGHVLARAVGLALLQEAGLPADLAPTAVSFNTTEAATRAQVGQVTDAYAFIINTGNLSVRMVVIVPGVLVSRLSRHPIEAAADRERDEALRGGPDGIDPSALPDSRRPLSDPLSWVPIDLAVELGRARVPLSAVMRAPAGELLELDRESDDPVALVCEAATVALGELQVNDRNRLELCITSVVRAEQHHASPTLVPTIDQPSTAEDDPNDDPTPEEAN